MRSFSPRIRFALAVLVLCTAAPRILRGQGLSPNLLYTSLQPCRLVDTRLATAGALAAGVSRTFNVTGNATDSTFTGQGGHTGGCGIPGLVLGEPAVQAVVLNFVAVGSAGPGDLVVWPSDQSQPLASTLNYAASHALSGLNIANGLLIPIRQDQQGAEITALAQVSGTHLVADVVGYFSAGGANLSLGPGSGGTPMPTASGNVAIGRFTMPHLTSGTNNTIVGSSAGLAVTTGSTNTCIGVEALPRGTTASFNVAIGESALANLVTGSTNIAIGPQAGGNLTGNEAEDIYIGSGGVTGESNTIRIGALSSQVVTIIEGIAGASAASGAAVFVTSDGHLGTVTSSRRFKEDVEDMGEASDRLMRLRPVTFHYKPTYDNDAANLQQYGLVAEEVAEIAPDLVQYDETGWPYAVRYHLINAMLLNEVQKQHRQADTQREQIRAQSERIAAQVAEDGRQRRLLEAQRLRIEAQEARIDAIERELKVLVARTGDH